MKLKSKQNKPLHIYYYMELSFSVEEFCKELDLICLNKLILVIFFIVLLTKSCSLAEAGLEFTWYLPLSHECLRYRYLPSCTTGVNVVLQPRCNLIQLCYYKMPITAAMSRMSHHQIIFFLCILFLIFD